MTFEKWVLFTGGCRNESVSLYVTDPYLKGE